MICEFIQENKDDLTFALTQGNLNLFKECLILRLDEKTTMIVADKIPKSLLVNAKVIDVESGS